MRRVLLVARREFLATAATPGFLIGVLVTPLLLGALMLVLPRLLRQGPPAVSGEVAVIDPTGRVAAGLRAYLSPQNVAVRHAATVAQVEQAVPGGLAAGPGAQEALERSLGGVPRLTVAPVDPSVDLQAARQSLQVPGGAPNGDRLALVVIHADAVTRLPGQERFGSYDLFVRSRLDERVEHEIQDGVRDAIVAARLDQAGLDRRQLDALTHVDRVRSRAVATDGEQRSRRGLDQMIPMAFVALLLVSVMVSGQYLLTTTVEEKSSRVVEVLLSAASPTELMAGKVVGQLGVGLVVMSLYLGLGLVALVSIASVGLLDPLLVVALFAFYLLAYLSLGALMAAIGAAVNDLREAQGLMLPVTIAAMVPFVLWMPISQNPNGPLAVALSFVPPLGNFVIVLRLASSAPPPGWQVALAAVAGLAGALGCLWFAGRVFRIGLLMFGKPPSIRVLLRWARMH